MLGVVAFIGLATAFDLPDNLKGIVDPITSIASMTCSNKYINNTEDAFTVDDVLCSTDLVPQVVRDYIPQIEFGPNSTICAGYACALRFLGCVEATYRIESKIVSATGKAETCAERVGLNVSTCQAIGKWITQSPLVGGRKRDVVESALEPFTEQELRAEMKLQAEVAAAGAAHGVEVTPAMLHYAKLLIRHHYPAEAALVQNFGLADDETLAALQRKRDFTIPPELAAQAQVCNPLISTLVDLIVKNVPAVAFIQGKFGPCGQVCELAMCGLTLMCHTVSRSALLTLEATRMGLGCNKTSCSRWVPPVDVCGSAPACDAGAGFFPANSLDLTKCAAPAVIHTASQQDKSDCCDRCDDVCKGVFCVEPKCGVPQWPLCKQFVVEKQSPYDCCTQCINICDTTSAKYAQIQPINCPAPPAGGCPAGKYLAPASPGTCCLTCVDACVGVACPDSTALEAQCKSSGGKWTVKDRTALGASPQCADCCPYCVTTSSPVIGETGSAASALLSVAALIVAALFAVTF